MSTDFDGFVSTAQVTRPERAVALRVLAILAVGYSISAPFFTLPLTPFPAFVPTMGGTVSMGYLLTAVLLCGQFAMTRSRAVLVLASGYMFLGLVAVVRIATFPGVFSPTGLLGAGLQTAPWLYVISHLGFPAAVAGYAILKDRAQRRDAIRSSASNAICWSLIVVFGLIFVVTWAVTAGKNYLPPLLLDGIRVSPLAHYAAAFDLAMLAIALALLIARQRSILDQWLTISLSSMGAELALIGYFTPDRYSVGFYAAGVLALLSSLAVLAALHAEVGRQYSRLVNSLLVMRREQESRMLSVQGATGVLAHEIKQPLSAIALEAETARRYLRQRSPNLEEVGVSLEAIASDAIRASEVITTIRKLLKHDDQEMRPVDLNGIVADVLDHMREELEAHAVAVELSLMAGLPAMRGNKGQLVEVLLNLLRNAVEALAEVTSRKRVVRIQTGVRGRHTIIVRMEDTGPGFDPNIAGEIFDWFKTTKSSGMGLGLALSRIIVEQHGGEIGVVR